MDAQDVERLLREDAARYERELAAIDVEAWKQRVLARLGLSAESADRPGPRFPGR